MFSLRYCNWNKDLFMGLLPNSQFGDIAVVDVSGVSSTPLVISGTSQPVKVGLSLQGSSTQNFISSTSELVPNSGLSVSVPAFHSVFLLFVRQKLCRNIVKLLSLLILIIAIRLRLILV